MAEQDGGKAMSDSIETAGLQYGLILDGDTHISFTELEYAKNHALFLDRQGVKYELKKREVHTRVNWTPWEDVEQRR